MPGLRARSWWDADPKVVEATSVLEAHWACLRDEVCALEAELTPYAEPEHGLVADGAEWNAMFLRSASSFTPEGRASCPRSCEVLASLGSLGGQVVASALDAGGHIPAHCGPWNTRLSIHLGLDVPPGCEIRVANESRPWEEGRCLTFDDSFEHEVWNRGRRTRRVLIVDVWHPDLTAIEVGFLEMAEAMF
jgi:aspartyl/asparaginyl beta-hydroxylase (cupin superfamily)